YLPKTEQQNLLNYSTPKTVAGCPSEELRKKISRFYDCFIYLLSNSTGKDIFNYTVGSVQRVVLKKI
ncbi:MAG: hypothetical protein ACKOEV_09950, partial [Cytophagales bacterium]